MRTNDIVLVDTNVMIHAHSRGCWSAIAGGFRLQTVEKCIEETQTGNQDRPPERQINEQALRNSLDAVHSVSQQELAAVMLLGGAAIDKGERELWAHALTRTDVWFLCGPDRGSMRFGYDQKLRERLVSLEKMLQLVGSRASIHSGYGQAWLDSVMNKLVLGIL